MIRLSHVSVLEGTAEDIKNHLLQGKIGQSELIGEFEKKFAQWLGVKHCIAVASGTVADTIALGVLKHFNPGKDEVIVPALTFIAQVNSIYFNHLKPVFVDVGADLRMSIENSLEKTTKRTLCLYPVHLLGRPVSATSIRQMDIPVVEDACEALGSESMNGGVGFMKCGSIGDIGTFSFFPSHTISTGEGGMISTNDDDYAALARRLRNHGKCSDLDFHFDVIGLNGKMNSLEAAVGIGFMPELNEAIRKRRENFFKLGGTEEERLEKICPHAFPVICASREERDFRLKQLRAHGIECRNLFSSVPTQEKAYEFLGHKLGEFPVAEMIGDRGLYVPSHQGLTDEDIRKIRVVLG